MKLTSFSRYAYLGIGAASLVGVAGFFYGLKAGKFTIAYSGVLSVSVALSLTPIAAVTQGILRRKLEQLESEKADAESAYNLGYESALTVAAHDNKLEFARWEEELRRSHQVALEEHKSEWSSQTQELLAVEVAKVNRLEESIKVKNAELIELQKTCDRLPELEYQIVRLEKRIARYQEDVEEVEIEKGKLKDSAIALEKWDNNLKSLHAQIRAENDSLTQTKLDMAEAKATYQVLQKELMDKEQEISKLKADMGYQADESIKLLEEQFKAGLESGYSQATSEWSLSKEKMLLQIERLRIRCGEKEANEALEKRLPELVDVLKNERKPFMIVGSQGSGKALAASAIAQFYAGEAGLLPFVLDISEGGSTDSTWHKLGIPTTADARLCLCWMQSVVSQLDPAQKCLPQRNDRASYDAAPAIVLIIDELMTCLDDLNKSEKEQFIKCLKAFETRGNKRKVFVGLLSQNEQIQNLNKVTNTGRLSNFYKILLNDQLVSKCSNEMLDKSEDLRDYLEVYRENYKCAVVYNNAKGEVMKPCKHPSHWGNKIEQTLPSRVVEISLHAPYDWFPLEVRELFDNYLPNGEDC